MKLVVRPAGIHRTPYQLAQDLGGQTRRWPNRLQLQLDYNRDVILAPVPPGDIRDSSREYEATYYFMTRNKYGQRTTLSGAEIPIPASAITRPGAADLTGEHFVVRPLRHSRGFGYRVTRDRFDFRDGQEYISELYPKRREYRVIFVKGEPVVWLRKKPNEGIGPEAPWGHENSFFQTINDATASPLSRTDAVQRLSQLDAVRGAHLCAADILWAGKQNPDKPYAVLELNFCPALDIDNNRAKVADALRQS